MATEIAGGSATPAPGGIAERTAEDGSRPATPVAAGRACGRQQLIGADMAPPAAEQGVGPLDFAIFAIIAIIGQ